eukprot:TRINITY_DN3722_c0_g1_i4.p1 TRINITY_DN3722_c0_g1~~TRINITY_DN3722_c0_g1_i4.p1  ORF type:complete len:893 (+),score=191.84 TRINITY_DN3722_c0_g1_i4:195-2873(+)
MEATWWRRSRLCLMRADLWAGWLLLNTPTDPVVRAKWHQELEIADEEGRKRFTFSMVVCLLAIIPRWDWLLAVFALGIVPLMWFVRAGDRFKRYGFLVYPIQLAWYTARMVSQNPETLSSSEHRAWVWATILFCWIEVSVREPVALVAKHLLVILLTSQSCPPRTTVLVVAISAAMFGVFRYRRRWDAKAADAITAMITREQLEQSQQEACFLRKLSDSKSVFLRTLCHELRNPMTAVQGNNEILVRKLTELTQSSRQNRAVPEPDGGVGEEHTQDPELTQQSECAMLRARNQKLEAQLRRVTEELDVVVDELPGMLRFSSNALLSAKHMSDVLNSTLTSTKLDSNEGQLASLPVPPSAGAMVCVRECFEAIVNMFEILAQRKRIDLRLIHSEGDFMVRVDEGCLKQSVINLLGNALKFTEEGSIVIAVCIISEDSGDQAWLECSVADTGIGMNEEEQAKVFRPFSQANSGIEAKYGGTGLGLNIVQQSLQRAGGAIRVKSVKHQGSTFTFELPVLVAAEGQDRDNQVQLQEPTQAASALIRFDKPRWRSKFGVRLEDFVESPRRKRRGSRNVLIVDDDVGVREVLREQLGSVLDCKVTTASNGAEAVRVASEQRFDLIVMDINMPVMGGLDATRAIRAGGESAENASTPIVGLSGNSLGTDMELAKQAGMDNYLTKPYNLAELCEVVSQYTQSMAGSRWAWFPSRDSNEKPGVEEDPPRCGGMHAVFPGRDSNEKPGVEEDPPRCGGMHTVRSRGVDPERQSVLVVDDEVRVRTMLADLVALLAPAAMVTQARDGLEAVQLASEATFDLIFTDLHMPGLNGMEVTRRIHKTTGSPNARTPIVLVTGTADDLETTLLSSNSHDSVGWHAAISKPYSMDDIERVLRDVKIVDH